MPNNNLKFTSSLLKMARMINEDANIFIEESIDYFEDKIPHMFNKQKDRVIAYAIVDLMKIRESIEDFNKNEGDTLGFGRFLSNVRYEQDGDDVLIHSNKGITVVLNNNLNDFI